MLATTQFWWHLSRAAGIVAWGLSAVAVVWGMALSTRALGSRPRAPWLLDLHRFLGGLTVVFVGLHLLGLWADSYVTFGIADFLIPMASSWKPGAVTFGVIAFYVLIAVEITSLLMGRLPKRLWRAIHVTSYLVFLSGTVHLLLAGTDARSPALWWGAIASLAATVFFMVYRLSGPGRRASARAGKETRGELSVT